VTADNLNGVFQSYGHCTTLWKATTTTMLTKHRSLSAQFLDRVNQ
jgi:hypothetical protein